jgi:hypothetical protein
MLDEAQYHAKNAGRYDLGGINHGNGYDVDAGLSKAGLYQIANGKKESVKAWGEKFTGSTNKTTGVHTTGLLEEANAGTTTYVDRNGNTALRPLTAAETHTRYEEAHIAEQELEAVINNSSGAVRDEAIKQRDALRSSGGAQYDAWKNAPNAAGRTKTVTNPITGAVSTPVLLNGEVAAYDKRVRNYTPPDPNNL